MKHKEILRIRIPIPAKGKVSALETLELNDERDLTKASKKTTPISVTNQIDSAPTPVA